MWVPVMWMVLGILGGWYIAWAWRRTRDEEEHEAELMIVPVETEALIPDSAAYQQLWSDVTDYLQAGYEVELLLPADTRQRMRELEREGW